MLWGVLSWYMNKHTHTGPHTRIHTLIHTLMPWPSPQHKPPPIARRWSTKYIYSFVFLHGTIKTLVLTFALRYTIFTWFLSPIHCGLCILFPLVMTEERLLLLCHLNWLCREKPCFLPSRCTPSPPTSTAIPLSFTTFLPMHSHHCSLSPSISLHFFYSQ